VKEGGRRIFHTSRYTGQHPQKVDKNSKSSGNSNEAVRPMGRVRERETVRPFEKGEREKR
jgi:hypothetical protein